MQWIAQAFQSAGLPGLAMLAMMTITFMLVHQSAAKDKAMIETIRRLSDKL